MEVVDMKKIPMVNEKRFLEEVNALKKYMIKKDFTIIEGMMVLETVLTKIKQQTITR